MADDRYESRRGPREHSRYQDDRYGDRGGRGGGGFFERAGEQIASWFGDDDDDDRGHRHDRMHHREREYGGGREGGWGSGHQPQGWGTRVPADREYGRDHGGWNQRGDWNDRGDRSDRSDRGERGGYRPVTGDYGRSEGMMAGGGSGRSHGGDWGGRNERSETPWGHDETRRTSFAGSSDRGPHGHDPHYHEWRQRQIEELDRDYDEYRREHQSKFENDFGTWRSNRQTKRQMLGEVRKHMEVYGNDDQPIGKVQHVSGDRIILAPSDESGGGTQYSLGCTDIERIEGDRVILGTSADQARSSWREERSGRDQGRERALFEREDQGEDGPHMLDRSFSGTYR